MLTMQYSARATNLESMFGSDRTRARHSSFSSMDLSFPGGFDWFENSCTGLPYPNMINDSSFPMS